MSEVGVRHTGEYNTHSGEFSETKKLSRTESRRLGRRAIVSALTNQSNELKIEDFTDIHSPYKIGSDQRYVEKFNGFVPENKAKELAPAQIFEQMFVNGVMLGNWLGNVDIKDQQVVENFGVEIDKTTPYDDKLNRIDAFATLSFDEPIRDEEYNTSIDKIALGFDVTVSGRREELLNKITRFYNGDRKQPFGFSQLDYYTSDGQHGSLSMLPRYTIGLSANNVNYIVETAHIRQEDGTVDFGLFSEQNLINRFKVLSEIRAENELYQAMLPDDLDSRVAQQANIQLNAADQCLHNALIICTNELVNRRCLPSQVIANIKMAQRKGRGTQARNIVQEYLLNKSQKIFAAKANKRAAHGKTAQGDGDTFVQIIQLCNELKSAAYTGKLDKYRQISAHTQSIPLQEVEPPQPEARQH